MDVFASVNVNKLARRLTSQGSMVGSGPALGSQLPLGRPLLVAVWLEMAFGKT
jgi:hypothetical protein